MGQSTEETVVVESDRLSRAGEEGQSVARRQLTLRWCGRSRASVGVRGYLPQHNFTVRLQLFDEKIAVSAPVILVCCPSTVLANPTLDDIKVLTIDKECQMPKEC